ncbi:MAG: hypothetical protein IT305_06745 [Chloroflexi bacterium]|nr:hypothetical protein [Chloroflexota bacterium]
MLVEHLFAAEVMRLLWRRGNVRMEVLKPQVDDGGYDLVLEANDIVRHVQLKASHSSASTHHVNVSLSLARRPSGCVVWCIFQEDTLALGPFLWFGGRPGTRLPSLDTYEVAKHPKANSSGVKSERPNLRSVPRRAFRKLDDVEQLVLALFGTITSP